MAKEERYDVVIIGAGHNGTTTAAYLAKCGLSVCVLEERPECGGAQETTEPTENQWDWTATPNSPVSASRATME